MRYAIGDIQGNLTALKQLLLKINFNPQQDYLYFLGDIVNRGSQSLQSLIFIKELYEKKCANTVLGNHDFFLLLCAYGHKKPQKKDSITEILNYPNKWALLDFLRSRPLLIEYQNNILIHAGIPPQWVLKTLKSQIKPITNVLVQSPKKLSHYLQVLNHDQQTWQPNLPAIKQQAYTINATMRMRFCKADGVLDFTHKNNPSFAPSGYQAWFLYPSKIKENIIFGHWSSLLPRVQYHYPSNIYPIDTGCIWGGKLSAICLKSKKITCIDCQKIKGVKALD